MKKIIINILILFSPFFAWGQSEFVEKAPPISYKLEVPIGQTTIVTSFAQYIDVLYRFAVGLAGIMAIAMIIVAGFDWVFAGGNEEKIKGAKDRISGALWGLIIVLTSYLLLNTINPALVSLKGAQIPKIQLPDVTTSLADLPACSEGIFKDSDCYNNGKATRAEAMCGQACWYNQQACHGVICASGTGGCYQDASDPKNKYSCQQKNACTENIASCYKKSLASMDFTTAFQACLCNTFVSSNRQREDEQDFATNEELCINQRPDWSDEDLKCNYSFQCEWKQPEGAAGFYGCWPQVEYN